jgi:hypothetical protein
MEREQKSLPIYPFRPDERRMRCVFTDSLVSNLLLEQPNSIRTMFRTSATAATIITALARLSGTTTKGDVVFM